MCVDLHTHSVYSDGTETPATLVAMAKANNLSGFSLTDHDTTDGIQEAKQAGLQEGIHVISGLEISAIHRGTSLHILGYGIQPDNPELCSWLVTLQNGRIKRNRKILEKLASLGIDINRKELQELSSCGQTGRPHIARLLIQKGIVKTMNQAFSLYLGANKPAWQSRFAYTAAESIAIIHKAGGIAVLAHPGQLDRSMKIQPGLIRELADRKLDGLEIHYPSHSRKMQKRFFALARQHDLIATGGSDFHGHHRVDSLAGTGDSVCPPDTIIEEILHRQKRYTTHLNS